MSDIKIFVSNRIDLRSEQIDNPLYVPMRCGAVFDPANVTGLAGDDTGDNISDKRMSFSELTVQYWAWKNADADYLGLCHYRRYLSFADRRFPADRYNMVHVPYLLPEEKKRFGLLDSGRMAETIRQYDAVTSWAADVKTLPVFNGSRASTVREWWEAPTDRYLPAGYLELMLKLIEKHSPAYLSSAREYLDGSAFRGNNCFVLKRELFCALCEFEFPILFELEQIRLQDAKNAAYSRVCGYIAEILYGIFFHRLEHMTDCRILKRQLVYFRDASEISGPAELRRRRMRSWAVRLVRPVSTALFPVGSGRREAIKKWGRRLKRQARR